MDHLNAWLVAIVESSDDAIVSMTPDGIITTWNPAAQRMFGYSADEAGGHSIAMLHPPDRAGEMARLMAVIAHGGRVRNFETTRIRKDGSPVRISVSISPILDGSGNTIGASKIARDITERDKADSKLQTQLAHLKLLESITRAISEREGVHSVNQVALGALESEFKLDLAIICSLDDSRETLTVVDAGPRSATLARSLGLTAQSPLSLDPDELARCLAGKLLYEPDTGHQNASLRLAHVGLRSVAIVPLQYGERMVGALLVARSQVAAFTGADCDFLAQLASHIALARKHAELTESLRGAYDELRASQQEVLRRERLQALGQMASGITHDMNNLVFPAAALVKEVEQGEPALSTNGRELLHTAIRALDDVAAMLARLRDFYRPRNAAQSATALSMNAVAQHVLAVLDPQRKALSQRGTRVKLWAELDAGMPTIMGSESEMREALMNLVLNAMDAVADGGNVRIQTGAYVAGRSTAEVAVVDDGIGMSEETRRRCLDPFYTTKGDGGTGMGLAMVYAIAQRHNAEISIDSAPGKGTRIVLRFLAFVAPAAPSPALRDPNARRILAVDDDPFVLETLKHMMRSAGHDIVTANGGEEALARFEREQATGRGFDLVITDFKMPDLDGHALARALKQRSPATPVLMVTGWGDEGRKSASSESFVDAVMNKPPSLRQLRAVVDQLTGASAASR